MALALGLSVAALVLSLGVIWFVAVEMLNGEPD